MAGSLPIPIKDGLPHNQVSSIYRDDNEDLWVVTATGIIKLIKPGIFKVYASQSVLPHVKNACLYDNETGELWIGTSGKGLFRLKKDSITAYGKEAGLPNLTINTLYKDRMKNLWIGTDGGGLTRVRMSDEHMSTLSGSNGLTDGFVYPIYEDKEGGLWVGTLDGGLHQLSDNRFTTYTTKEGLVDDYVGCITGDRGGDIWIGTKQGLSRMSRGVFTTHLTTAEGLLDNAVSSLFEDSSGCLWIGTDNGLNYLGDGIINVYTIPDGVKISLFRCAYEDNEGVTWFGTNSGLFRLKAGETTLYTVQNGLIDNHVYSVLEDGNGCLWLAGRSGISRIRKQELEDAAREKTGQVHPDWYNETEGMKSRWCTGAGYKTRDGRFWFPTAVGVTMIDPNDIKKNEIPPPLIIEKLVVDGKSINIKSFCGAGAVLSKSAPLVAEGKLELAPGKKRLEFYYTAVSFINPQKIRFKIKLEGYDSDWVDMKNLRSATYTGLDPGDYTFRVTARIAGGTWNENTASFSFYLRPYFYQATWIYVAVVLFIAMAVFSLFRYRYRRLLARKEELKRLVHLRTRDLEERNAELEKTRQKVQHSKELIEAKNRQLQEQSEKLEELDKAKSRFFANISHEFRTPLTLIKGPLEQILAGNPDKTLESRANMMLRNSRRLLNLVDQLLELAKFDSGKMKLHAARQNIVPFVKNIVMCFESLALQNKVDLTFQVESDDISLYFDPEKMDHIITNLLSNAFNYAPGGGKIGVSIRTVIGTAYPGGCVEIAVCNTGAGIPADQLPYIFDRFYRGETSHEYKRKGTGIGLALTKELVEIHHGEIEVHSSCRQDHTRGTKFILRLPRGNAYLQPEEIVNEAADIKTAPLIVRGCQPPHEKTFVDLENDAQIAKESKPAPGAPEAAEKDIILVVEDNADMRTYIRGALDPRFNVVEAANGKEGIDKAGEIIPDLVISDVMMPETDGYELCAHLKKDIKTSHIPVILLTAKASEKSMAEGLETGADDYITKPFNTDLLVIRVRNLIRLRRQLQWKIQQDMMLHPGVVSVSSIDTEFIKEIQDIMEKNLSDPEFNVEQMANKLYMSPKTLRRKVEALTGETTTRLIRSYRLMRAAQLLKANFGNVTEVSFAVGFSSTAYFTKCFKEKFHQLPHTFQGPGSDKG